MPYQDDIALMTVASSDNGCCDLPPSLRWSNPEAERLAGLFKAIGHPVRLQIVELLSRFGGQVCVCDIEGQFALKQPTISHHLKLLRNAGLIACEQRGQWIYYFTREPALAQLRDVMADLADHRHDESRT